MTRYVVFEPPARDGSGPGSASEHAVFVRDGFSFWAFLFPWVWLLRYGLFVSAVLVFLAGLGLIWLASQGLGALAWPLLLLLSLLVALEGPSLRGWRVRRKRYAETGAVQAASPGEAAIFYYTGARTLAAPAAGGGTGMKGLPWRFERPAGSPAERRGGWRNLAAGGTR